MKCFNFSPFFLAIQQCCGSGMIFFGSVSGSYFSVGFGSGSCFGSYMNFCYYSYSIHIMKRYNKLFIEFFFDKKKHIFLN
jgi:hypothetical protein